MIKFVDGHYVEMSQEEIEEANLTSDPIEMLQNEIDKLREEITYLKGGNSYE